MNAKKAPPEGRAKKRTFTWLRRGLLAALIAAAAALAWLRLPAPAPSDAPEPDASLSDRRRQRRHPFALRRPYRYRGGEHPHHGAGGALTPSRRHVSPDAASGAIMGR